MPDLSELAEDLIARAKTKGAEAAEAHVGTNMSISVAQRMGKREKMERAEAFELSLRVYMGKRRANVSSSDPRPATLDELAERAIAMAKAVPEDEFCGLAEKDLLAKNWPDLDLFDSTEPSEKTLAEKVALAEESALAISGITNSEGAEAGWSMSSGIMAATNGFRGKIQTTHWGLSVAVLAGEGSAMERDYDFSSAIFGSDLEASEAIGHQAANRALRRLHPKKIDTGKMPIIYDPRVSAGLLGHFAGAINGNSVARGASFLKDSLKKKIFADGIIIVDDPLRRRGLGSRPFDGEGVQTQKMILVGKGILKSWLLDCRSARQLGLRSTGHSAGGGPGASNLYMEPGVLSPAELMADIKRGFYVTELMGMGVNGVTGDYSRGAAGFLIENGKLAHPVSEVTIAGNLKEMFLEMRPANDLVFRYRTNAPTIRIDSMTLAGQ